jgi:phosphoserine phosphatase RsbU/P
MQAGQETEAFAPSRKQPSHAIQCDEIWGGISASCEAVSVPGLDTWVFSYPVGQDETGGDVHYVSLCGKGLLSRFVVADVSGHGRDVQNMAEMLRGLMRENIMQPDMTNFVQKLNRRFESHVEDGKFATAVAASYVAPTEQLHVINAGHPYPLWYRGGERRWQRLDEHIQVQSNGMFNLPLGVVGETDYTENRIQLGRGDLVVLYTDSLVEAHDDSGRQLGTEGLERLCRQLDATRPEQFGEALLASVAAHRAGHPADDDETLMVLHRNGHTPELF